MSIDGIQCLFNGGNWSDFDELNRNYLGADWPEKYLEVFGRIDEVYMTLKPVETINQNRLKRFIKGIFT